MPPRFTVSISVFLGSSRDPGLSNDVPQYFPGVFLPFASQRVAALPTCWSHPLWVSLLPSSGSSLNLDWNFSIILSTLELFTWCFLLLTRLSFFDVDKLNRIDYCTLSWWLFLKGTFLLLFLLQSAHILFQTFLNAVCLMLTVYCILYTVFKGCLWWHQKRAVKYIVCTFLVL